MVNSIKFEKKRKHFLLIACEVLYREFSYLAALSENTIDIIWLSQGLHDLGPEKMSAKIQETINNVQTDKYDAILLGYALCNNGVENIMSPDIQIVIPKAHDCITLFLGSRKRYKEYFDNNPGTYFLSSGWIERDETNMFEVDGTINQKLGLDFSMNELIEKYGEENARYVAETMGNFVKNYQKITYIKTVFEEDDNSFIKEAENMAAEKDFEFECIDANLTLLKRLLDGKWEDDFLILSPGEKIKASFNDDIVKCINCR